MPSIITHVAVPLAMYCAAGRGKVSKRLLAAGIITAALPDLDVVAFAFGIPYADALGHRGASHSIVFALLLAFVGGALHRPLRSRPLQAAAWIFVCALSHPLLDALTSGGLGVALLWPFSGQSFFAPWRPILVSSFANGFFSACGIATLWSELRWMWLPLFAAGMAWKLLQRRASTRNAGF